MTLEDRLALIRAGYTRAEIEEMANAMEPPAPDPAPAPTPDPDPVPAPAPTPDPAPADAPAWATALTESINKMTAMMQANNAMFDDMGDPQTAIDAGANAMLHYLGGPDPAAKSDKKGGK